MDDAVNEICAETDTMAAGAPLPDEISSRSTTTYWLLRIGGVAAVVGRSARRWVTSCTP
jgi:hypothetical protein